MHVIPSNLAIQTIVLEVRDGHVCVILKDYTEHQHVMKLAPVQDVVISLMREVGLAKVDIRYGEKAEAETIEFEYKVDPPTDVNKVVPLAHR